jgi:hypothetical protein
MPAKPITRIDPSTDVDRITVDAECVRTALSPRRADWKGNDPFLIQPPRITDRLPTDKTTSIPPRSRSQSER